MLGLVGIVAKRLKQFVADEEGRGVKADRESDFQAATTAESPLMQRRHLIPRGGGGFDVLAGTPCRTKALLNHERGATSL